MSAVDEDGRGLTFVAAMRADFRGQGWPKIFSEHSDTLVHSEKK